MGDQKKALQQDIIHALFALGKSASFCYQIRFREPTRIDSLPASSLLYKEWCVDLHCVLPAGIMTEIRTASLDGPGKLHDNAIQHCSALLSTAPDLGLPHHMVIKRQEWSRQCSSICYLQHGKGKLLLCSFKSKTKHKHLPEGLPGHFRPAFWPSAELLPSSIWNAEHQTEKGSSLLLILL